jgi:outer membrane protein assembly factor BamB
MIHKIHRLLSFFGFLLLSSILLMTSSAEATTPGGVGKDIAYPETLDANDWPWWRGPNRNGVAASDQQPPLHWNETDNILWKSSVPGRGHGSPTVVGNQVFLATAEHKEELQSVFCYDRNSGRRLWKTEVHVGGFGDKGHKKANLAAATVASDGRSVFINFLNREAIYTTALSREGRLLWQTKASDFAVHQGFGSSPAIYGSLVIVSADNTGGGALVALDSTTGKIVWRQERPKKANYTSPVILRAAGREQLLLIGCDLVSSFDPLSGEKLWEVEGATTECVTSTVTDGQLVLTSGGYPKKHVSAVWADGTGRTAWAKNIKVYVPSMLVRDGFIFLVTDAGIARCWKSQTGEEIWRGRLGGTFSASPILVGEHIFATNEDGETFIFKANPEKFELVAKNDLGDEVIATPTICGSRIYMRVAEREDGRSKEFLYCISE